ncbi:MAG: 1-(5-phosphoribosyl)-5-[(5-phosphoribosylamino)methylideneamino]imidazole-4-carboxamide isomerase [Chloroflexota bacterium]
MDKVEFVIYPAIDLRDGRVVRLMQGDPARQTIYGNDPAGVARGWLEAGARWLHVVNLDGAFGETKASQQGNLAALQAILSEVSRVNPAAQVQFGGGLRSMEVLERALEMGVGRVVVGSLAVEAPEFLRRALECFGAARLALAVDVRDGQVYTRGWQEPASVSPGELGRAFAGLGLRTCIYTDIQRDGGGQGLNLAQTRDFAKTSGLEVVASGGVASLADVHAARQAGLSGVVIGRALYEGQVDLREALRC